MMTNNCGVYKITNTITGDFYIGSANNIWGRIRRHRSDLANNRHGNIYLQRVWNKYGKQAFEFTAILLCDIEHKLYFEQGFLDLFKPVYNIATCVLASWQGLRHTDEQRRKISEAGKGKHHTEETKRKIGDASKGNTNLLGYKHTEETKRKIGAAHKGSHRTDEARAKMSESHKTFYKAQRELQTGGTYAT